MTEHIVTYERTTEGIPAATWRHVRVGRGRKVHLADSQGPTRCGLGQFGGSGLHETDEPVDCDRCAS